MILDYLQIPYSYPRLLQQLQTQSFGTWFRNLSSLESYGLSVLVELGDIETIQRHLASGLPCIAYVDTEYLVSYWNEATNHAVVITGIEGDLIHLNDPFFSMAPQVVSINEFLPAWIEQKQLYAVMGLTDIE